MNTILKFGGNLNGTTGSLIQANGKSLCFEAGQNGNLIGIPLLLEPCITGSWMEHIWISCSQADIQIVTSSPEIPLLHQRDLEIMKAFLQAGYCKMDLVLNHGQMFLQVFFSWAFAQLPASNKINQSL